MPESCRHDLDSLAVDIGWSILWARASGYRVAPYYPLLDSRDGVLCPLEALAGRPLGGNGLAVRLGLSESLVFDFTYGVDGGSAFPSPAVKLGQRFRAELGRECP